jgi:hypothetical protein
VCNEVPPEPHGDQDKCAVYSIGIGDLPLFDISSERDKGCKVRSFDPTVKRPDVWPNSIKFHAIGLSGEDKMDDAEMPVGTLKSLKGLHKEQSEGMYILKVDCEGCEWAAFTQIIKEEGPLALAKYDQVMFEIHVGWGQYSPQRAMSLVALLFNADFQPYWRHFNPWSIAGTSDLLEPIRELYGDELAEEYRASETSFARLGKEFQTYKPEDRHYWINHVQPDKIFCCWEGAYVRADALAVPAKGD